MSKSVTIPIGLGGSLALPKTCSENKILQVCYAGWLVVSLCASYCIVPTPAKADWINLSGAENARNIAEIHITRDHVKIEFEIFVGDAVTFHRLIPDKYLTDIKVQRPPLNARMRQFSSEDLRVIADGEQLVARLELFEPRFRKVRRSPNVGKINPYTGQPIPGPPNDKRVLYAELVYPFRSRPQSLTIVPPLDENGVNRATIGFMTFHKGVPIHDFKYLSESSTVTLDWIDPWYSEFANKALRRWQTGGVLSFLYIEPYEVRHEILARVKDLSAWMDLGLQGDEFIEADENEPLKQRVGDFFLKHDRVLIDGKQLRPILDRTSFVKYSSTASVFVQQPERLPIDTAMVGVIVTYLTPGIPQEVSCQWDLWSERIRKVPTDAIDPAGGFPSYVTPDDNVQVWRNFLKQYTIPTVEKVAVAESLHSIQLPLASVACGILVLSIVWRIQKRKLEGKRVGVQFGFAALLVAAGIMLFPHMKVSVTRPGSIASRVTNDEGAAIVENLLKNVYRAFDFRAEEDVYVKLAVSASGDLLTELYLQNRRSFQVQQAGGAQANVKEIDVLDVNVESSPKRPRALNLRSHWTALGTVSHWGHIHTRQNRYQAIVTVEPVEGAWKITGLDLLEEERLESVDAQVLTGA